MININSASIGPLVEQTLDQLLLQTIERRLASINQLSAEYWPLRQSYLKLLASHWPARYMQIIGPIDFHKSGDNF